MKMRLPLLVLGFLVARTWAGETEPPSLLILPFDAEEPSSQMGEHAADLLAAHLSPYSEAVQIVDRSEFEVIAREKSLAQTGFTDARARDVAKLLGARYVVRGNVRRTRSGYDLTAFLCDTATTQILKSYQSKDSKLAVATQYLAEPLARTLSVPLRALPDLPPEEDPVLQSWMIVGLGAYHQGYPHRASAAFLNILSRQSHPEALFWLARSFSAEGLVENARITYEQFLEKYPRHPRAAEARTLMSRERKP